MRCGNKSGSGTARDWLFGPRWAMLSALKAANKAKNVT